MNDSEVAEHSEASWQKVADESIEKRRSLAGLRRRANASLTD
jgi:hypothetical protein